MPAFKIFKENALPSTFEPSSMYLIASPTDNNYLELFVTDKDGIAARSTMGVAKVRQLIAEYLNENDLNNPAPSKSMYVVDTIADRDALELYDNAFVFVLNATGDSTVAAGSASYVYNFETTTYSKVAEYESMDLVLSWDKLTGRPESTPQAIDAAVAKAHEHANATTLDKLSTSPSGDLLFNGQYPIAGLSSSNW